MGPKTWLLGVVFGLLLVGCSGTTQDETTSVEVEVEDSVTSTSTSTPDSSAAISATTTTTSTTASTPTTTSIDSASSSTTAAAEESTTTDGSTTTTVPPTTGQVVTPGDVGSFTSPSGNIACGMGVELGVSCWISEKAWSIEQPDGPNCAESDYGNAVDVTDTGVSYPCYTDFSWDPTAPPLAYGDRMTVGGFTCASEESGVTCTNQDEQGFRLARAEVVVF